MRCIGARERCACATSCTIWDSTVSVPDFIGAHNQRAVAVQRGADDAVADGFLDRDRFAGQHRFVDARPPFDDHTIDGHLLAGAHAQPVADMNVRQRDVLFGAVSAQSGVRSLAQVAAAP